MNLLKHVIFNFEQYMSNSRKHWNERRITNRADIEDEENFMKKINSVKYTTIPMSNFGNIFS